MKIPAIFTRRAQLAGPVAELSLFHLRAARGNWLVVGSDSRIVMAGGSLPSTALVLCVPAGGPQASFLVAPDARPLSVEGDGLVGPAISARLRRVPDGRVELRHPVAPMRCLGVVFGAPGNRPNRVMFDRIGHANLDRFELHPADRTL